MIHVILFLLVLLYCIYRLYTHFQQKNSSANVIGGTLEEEQVARMTSATQNILFKIASWKPFFSSSVCGRIYS